MRGDFDRHLRRHRRLYQRRREALLAAVAAQLPEIRVSGAAAGLHAVLHVPDAAAVAQTAHAHGIALEAIGGALVVGYANLPEAQAPAAVEALAACLQRGAASRTPPGAGRTPRRLPTPSDGRPASGRVPPA